MANLNVDNEHRGVIRQALLEATGGFAANRFPEAEREPARTLFLAMDAGKSSLEYSDLPLIKQSLRFALKELGPEEFQTITSYDYDFGQATLKFLETQ